MELGWVAAGGDNATRTAITSRHQHEAAYQDWEKKLEAVKENGWQDKEMISELETAWKNARAFLAKRISSDRVDDAPDKNTKRTGGSVT